MNKTAAVDEGFFWNLSWGKIVSRPSLNVIAHHWACLTSKVMSRTY